MGFELLIDYFFRGNVEGEFPYEIREESDEFSDLE